jgi:hypothetical protein
MDHFPCFRSAAESAYLVVNRTVNKRARNRVRIRGNGTGLA